MRYKVLILVIILWQSNAIYAQSNVNLTLPEHNPFKEMLPVDFCEVTRHPQSYDGKVIRLRAIFSWTFESSALLPYDSKDCWDWMRFGGYDCPDERACRELSGKLRPPRGKELEVVKIPALLVGRFRYRRFLTSSEARYGFHHYEFIVTNFVEYLKPNDRSSTGPARP
jgi:hypothetical protein